MSQGLGVGSDHKQQQPGTRLLLLLLHGFLHGDGCRWGRQALLNTSCLHQSCSCCGRNRWAQLGPHKPRDAPFANPPCS